MLLLLAEQFHNACICMHSTTHVLHNNNYDTDRFYFLLWLFIRGQLVSSITDKGWTTGLPR